MGSREEFFKEELAGSIQKRIFKARLTGDLFVVSPRMKLIVPIVKIETANQLLSAVHQFDQFEWNDQRGHHNGLTYAGYPVAEQIGVYSFYLLNDWQIYHRHRHLMKGTGWIEMGPEKNIHDAFNYFIPLGTYHAKDYYELTYADLTTEVIPFPEYDTEGNGDNGVLIKTTNLRKIMYCSIHGRVDLADLIGVPLQNFSQRGDRIVFPTWEVR